MADSYSEKLLLLRRRFKMLHEYRDRHCGGSIREWERVTRQIRDIRERMRRMIELGDAELLQRRV
ncbi:hypothetical protein R3P38DRAFT_3190023 [Favolaschia claudopus]|uniref:Uncharacterized protein n=1 Tax=Favolaschia claudopus TaxID=2862362 RepID=A0AAW0BPD4_9AGAR